MEAFLKEGKLPSYIGKNLSGFFDSYMRASLKNNYSQKDVEPLLLSLLQLAALQVANPYKFELYHRKITSPFDYYQFGLDFIRPLIDRKRSLVKNPEILDIIEEQIKKGENVVFFANHQIEPDPQVISVLLEKSHPKLAEDMIFVAGHRVVTDPLAVPFSLGRNLLCIYSKKHMQHVPDKKAEKVLHNQRTMKILSELLAAGGKCIYVAPSGGRDRPDPSGKVLPAPFDPQSIDMFLLIAKRAKTPTHFYPLVLSTHHILPPPNMIEEEIGEKRLAECAPVFLQVANEIAAETLGSSENKLVQRQKRADTLNGIVKNIYTQLEAS
jgi:glycerol-3-phosphate O-acyltransferase